MVIWEISLILLLVAINGFFVCVEFAVITSRRTRIDVLTGPGNRSAQIVKSWLEDPTARDKLIAAAQLGITIASLALGAVGENTFERWLDPIFHNVSLPIAIERLTPLISALPLILSLIIVTSLHVVLGEQVPKVAALHNPERYALLLAQPMNVFTKLFKWFVDLLDWITKQILRLMGLKFAGGHSVIYTVEELRQIISDSEEVGVIQSPEREMLDAIFDLGGLLVRQVMIPRTEIVAVEADDTMDQVINVIQHTTHTKLPVYEDDLDQILGVLHVKNMIRYMKHPEYPETTARGLTRETIFVPETLPINVLIHRFRDQNHQIAIVLDEYGGTAGLVTLEDLLEEIVGDVYDPFETDTPEIQSMPDGTALVDGVALIEEVNEHMSLDLQDPHYDTIAGYMLGKLGRIPQVGDVVESDGTRLRVEEMDGLRINRLSLTQIDNDPAREEGTQSTPGE
jgi:CBS domain containing-hemolysin-like protein